ncbi:hypothetical protein ACLOJK_016545 [Asimina triloba]
MKNKCRGVRSFWATNQFYSPDCTILEKIVVARAQGPARNQPSNEDTMVNCRKKIPFVICFLCHWRGEQKQKKKKKEQQKQHRRAAAMASIGSRSCSPPLLLLLANTQSLRFSISRSAVSLSVSMPVYPVRLPAVRASASDQGVGGDPSEPVILQKPLISSSGGISGISDVGEKSAAGGGGRKRRWVHWEDQILEETVPLVGFVRMILHSGNEISTHKGGKRGIR